MRRTKVLLSLLMIVGLFLAACGNNETTSGEAKSDDAKDSKEQVVIQFGVHYPTGHYLNDVNQVFMDRATELSGGKIKFEYYPGGQLGAMTEIASLVKDGAVDMGYVYPPGTSFLPLSTVVNLPSLATDALTTGKVQDQLLDGVLKEELEKNNLVKIASFMNPAHDIITADKKVEKIEDIKGLKIYASGGIHSAIPGLFDATPVTVQVPDIYQSTQTKVLDGSLFPLSAVGSYHLDEVTKYLFEGSNFGGTNSFYAINKQKWDTFPKDVQDALIEAGKESTILHGEVNDKEREKGLKLLEESGVEITKATPEQHKEIIKKMEPLDEIWVKDMEKKGVKREKAEEVLAEYKKFTEQAVAEKK